MTEQPITFQVVVSDFLTSTCVVSWAIINFAGRVVVERYGGKHS